MDTFIPKTAERIVCLTEETTELLYLMGEQDRIVGVSGYTVRPPRARKEKPKVSAFTSAKIDKILDLKPDLVLGFSDMQADIAKELVLRGVEVHIFNQRSIAEIFSMIKMLGNMIGEPQKANHLLEEFSDHLNHIQRKVEKFSYRPKVFFEEWYDPIITGIQWVSELVTLAGGQDIFPELAAEGLGKNRILKNPNEVISRNPDVIIGSWCGRHFRPEKVTSREGWQDITAVKTGQLYEIKSSLILQPGPAALTEGVDAIHDILASVQ